MYIITGTASEEKLPRIFANNLKLVYPNPSDVTAVPNTTLAELRRTRATTVLLELAYHDNPQDTQWLVNNIEEIAKNLSLSFGFQFTGKSEHNECCYALAL